MSQPPSPSSGPPGIQAVVFDLNGVLTSDMRRNVASLSELYGIAAPAELIAEVFWPLYRQASVGQIEPAEMWLRFGQEVANGAPPLREPNQFWVSQLAPREPGLRRTLGQLRRRYALGVMSNHIGIWARAALSRIGLLGMLDAVVISSEAAMRKPDPRLYLRVCEMLHVAPTAAVYVADEEEDVEAAASLGMMPVFIPGEDETSRVGVPIARVSELPALLRQL